MAVISIVIGQPLVCKSNILEDSQDQLRTLERLYACFPESELYTTLYGAERKYNVDRCTVGLFHQTNHLSQLFQASVALREAEGGWSDFVRLQSKISNSDRYFVAVRKVRHAFETTQVVSPDLRKELEASETQYIATYFPEATEQSYKVDRARQRFLNAIGDALNHLANVRSLRPEWLVDSRSATQFHRRLYKPEIPEENQKEYPLRTIEVFHAQSEAYDTNQLSVEHLNLAILQTTEFLKVYNDDQCFSPLEYTALGCAKCFVNLRQHLQTWINQPTPEMEVQIGKDLAEFGVFWGNIKKISYADIINNSRTKIT